MKKISISQARIEFGRLVELAARTRRGVLITKHGSPAAVMMSASEYESLRETAAVRSDTVRMQEIKRGIRALNKGKARYYTLDGLFKERPTCSAGQRSSRKAPVNND